jgi:plasmid maintenance system antidote protein VapI
MARPKGHKINQRAWDDILRFSGKSLTQVATGSDIPRPSLSGVVTANQNASVPMAHKIAAAIGCHPETLFPSLADIVAKAAA